MTDPRSFKSSSADGDWLYIGPVFADALDAARRHAARLMSPDDTLDFIPADDDQALLARICRPDRATTTAATILGAGSLDLKRAERQLASAHDIDPARLRALLSAIRWMLDDMDDAGEVYDDRSPGRGSMFDSVDAVVDAAAQFHPPIRIAYPRLRHADEANDEAAP